MPSLFALAVYLIRVRNVTERKFETLSSFLDQHDLLEVAKRYLEQIKKDTSDDEAAQLVLRIPALFSEKRRLFGTIETGAYGLESTLYHRKKKMDVHKRTRDEADMSPFFFLLDVPEDVDEGVLILQRAGTHGIRKILYTCLAPTFQEEFENLRLRIDPLVLEKELKKLMKGGRVTEIRFCRFGLSSDIADHYEGGHQESPGRTELVFHARRGDRFNFTEQLGEILKGKQVTEVFALEDMDFDFETVKVGLSRGGRTTQVDLSHIAKIRSYHDVTDRLRITGSGHPDFESIKQAALDLLTETRQQLYGRAGAQ